MLKMDIGLLFIIFFLPLFVELLGLIMVGINLQTALERALLYFFFFWEAKSERAILKKNLVMHQKKNRLKFVIYAPSLGRVIFLLTYTNY